MSVKPFSLRTILSVTTGRLLTEPGGPDDNGIGRMYALLGHMTGDEPFTHQLPRFADECKPWLLRWFPELSPVSSTAAMESLDRHLKASQDGPQTGISYWLAEIRMMHPSIKHEYEVGRIPADDHERKHPYDELVQMRGSDEGIDIVITPE